MAKRHKARERKKHKELQRRRRLDKQRNATPLAKELTPKLAEKVEAVYDLIHNHEFAEAEASLKRLAGRYDRYPAVIEAQVFFYQEVKDHEGCSQAARRLMKLTPRDPDARMIYAQESMFCGRIAIALTNYRLFLQQWPDHANCQKARNAIELVEPECEDKLGNMGFEEPSLELLVMHEEILECVGQGHFEDAIEKCSRLLKLAPNCIPARNNLALVCFQSGKIEQAVQVAEETCRLAPDNRYAEASLGKLRFLTGREDEANAIADQIVVNPPMQPDPLAAAIELLGFLGRNEDIVILSESVEDDESLDPRCVAMVLHHLAVAQCRLGDEKAGRLSWKKCLKAMPTHPDARENLDDLDSGRGHAPWHESIAKWIPRAVFDEMFADRDGANRVKHLDLMNGYPAIAALIPALLDRGDPLGRELAMKMAAADGSPAMLDALQDFALGSRGPDALRHEALRILGERGRIDSGPHRFYSRGKWTEVKLFMAEITWEATNEGTHWARNLTEKGTKALNRGDFDTAEELFSQILAKEPDNCTAAYNLSVVWLERDGEAGRQRAQARMEEIHEQFPDYRFAPISLAQFAAMDGDFDRAGKLLAPIADAKRLHVTEASALFATQIQIAVERREFEAAERSWALLVELLGKEDAKVVALRRIIDRASRRPNLRQLLSNLTSPLTMY